MNSNEYFKVSIKKETVEKVKSTVSGIRDTVAENADFFNAAKNGDSVYETDLPVVDQCIVPTEQEIPIRQYNIARLSTPLWKKAYGRLQVTNKRVVFRSTGKSLAGPVMIENEFSLEEIGGVEIKTDYRFNLLTFVLSGIAIVLLSAFYTWFYSLFIKWGLKAGTMAPAVVFSILTIIGTAAFFVIVRRGYLFKSTAMNACGISVLMIALAKSGKFGVVLAVIAFIVGLIMWIYAGIVDDLHILIKVKGAVGTMEIGRKLRTDERSGFSIVRPWKDTEIAIREIGALLDDVKRFGDAGIDKWKV